MSAIRIGTSGWHYRHWRGPYYPEKMASPSMLKYYAKDFDTVEINSSFYRVPAAGTFEMWRKTTPGGFCFAVKGSRYLTHRKKLLDPRPSIKTFLPPTERLGSKLGPILFQLPPRWRCNIDRLSRFLRVLPKRHRYSVEFRDTSWHNQAVYRVLEEHNVAFCIYELGGVRSPVRVTADFAYVRLHGPGAKYQGEYSTRSLDRWAKHIESWRRAGISVFFYFDNDQAGYAVKNARELKRAVGV